LPAREQGAKPWRAAVALLAAVACFGAAGCGAAGCGAAPAGEAGASEPVYGGEPDVYTARVLTEIEDAGGRRVSEGRVARRGDWRRQEWVEAGRRLATIIRPDLGLTYLVDLDRNAYVQRPDREAVEEPGEGVSGEEVEGAFAAAGAGAVLAREAAGSEAVDGHPCLVFRTRIEAADGGEGESVVWEAEDLRGLALRSELRSAGARVVTELRDVQTSVDPALFEPPPGARLVDALDVP
jgi:hypothetical protein